MQQLDLYSLLHVGKVKTSHFQTTTMTTTEKLHLKCFVAKECKEGFTQRTLSNHTPFPEMMISYVLAY